MSDKTSRSKDPKPEPEQDVEGHQMLSNPLLGEQLARVRERDIQRNLKNRQFEADARRPHKKER
jgi:hypothetical protein